MNLLSAISRSVLALLLVCITLSTALACASAHAAPIGADQAVICHGLDGNEEHCVIECMPRVSANATIRDDIKQLDDHPSPPAIIPQYLIVTHWHEVFDVPFPRHVSALQPNLRDLSSVRLLI